MVSAVSDGAEVMMRSTNLWALALATLVACTPSSPLQGPGVDNDGALRTDAEGPFLVVATHTKVAKGERKLFDDHVEAIDAQLPAQDGFVASSLRARMPGKERWTMTVWESEEALLDFVVSGAHARAMGDSAVVLQGLFTAQWTVDRGDWPPTWDEALAELDAVEPDPAFP